MQPIHVKSNYLNCYSKLRLLLLFYLYRTFQIENRRYLFQLYGDNLKKPHLLVLRATNTTAK